MLKEKNKKGTLKKNLPNFFAVTIVLIAIVFSASLILSEPDEVESAWSYSCSNTYEECSQICTGQGTYCIFIPSGSPGEQITGCSNQWTCVNDDIGGPCDQNPGLCEPGCSLTTDRQEYGPGELIGLFWRSWGGYRSEPPPITGNLVSCPNENPECWVPGSSVLTPPNEGSAQLVPDQNWAPERTLIKMRARFQQTPGPIRECDATFYATGEGGEPPPPPPPPVEKFCPVRGWAWNSDEMNTAPPPLGGLGWESFSSENQNDPANYGVWLDMEDGWLSGFTWHPTVGWIRFGGLSGFPSGDGTSSSNARVITSGDVVGWARACSVFEDGCTGILKENRFRGNWDGWISLRGTNYKVTFDEVTRKFAGWAWGGDKVAGWISWSSESPDHPRPTRNYGVTLGDENQCVNEVFNYGLFVEKDWNVLEEPSEPLPHPVIRQFVGTVAKPVEITKLTLTDVPSFGEIILSSEPGQNKTQPIPIPVSVPGFNNPHLIIEIPIGDRLDYVCPESEQGIGGYSECSTPLERYIVEGDSDVKKTEYLAETKEGFFKTFLSTILSLPKIFAQIPEPMLGTVCTDLEEEDPNNPLPEICSNIFINWGENLGDFDYELISSGSIDIERGSNDRVSVNRRWLSGDSESVTLSAPSTIDNGNISINIETFNPCTIGPSNPICDSQIRISPNMNATLGNHQFTVSGISDISQVARDTLVRFRVIEPGGGALISCTATPPFALVGQTVTWNAEIDPNLEYDFLEWSGHEQIEGQQGSQVEISDGYPNQGRKAATVTACDEGVSEGECIPIETSLECSTNIFFNLFFEQF